MRAENVNRKDLRQLFREDLTAKEIENTLFLDNTVCIANALNSAD